MKRIEQPAAIVQTAEETEQQLVNGIAAAESNAAWLIGEYASKLRERYDWTDQRIADETGLSQQRVNERRRVWETYGDVYRTSGKTNLDWAHYCESLPWDDAMDWLASADDGDWSVARMKSERDAHYGKSALDDAVESTAPQSSARRQIAEHFDAKEQAAKTDPPKTYNDTFDAEALDAAEESTETVLPQNPPKVRDEPSTEQLRQNMRSTIGKLIRQADDSGFRNCSKLLCQALEAL